MVAVAAVVLAGCVTPELGPVAGEDPPSDDQAPGDQAPDDAEPEEDPAAPGADPHGPDGQVPTCDDDATVAIDAVIGEQLAAFAADDYDRALELASQDFRAAIDADGLAGLIEDGYPVAAMAASHELGPCVQPSPRTAEVLVQVTAQDGARGDLIYRMVEEAPGWRISGALQVGDAPDDTVVAAGPAVP